MSIPRTRQGGDQLIPRPTAWRLGDLAPWSIDTPLDAESVVQVIERASLSVRPEPATFVGARPSAVLVALTDGPLGAEVLLTKRAGHLRNHAGEISFPGGRIEPGETRTLADIAGSGAVQHIWITTANLNWRDLILRVWWDGQETPSVVSPLGDFPSTPR